MIVIGAEHAQGLARARGHGRGTDRVPAAAKSRLTMRDMWLRFGGLAASMRAGVGDQGLPARSRRLEQALLAAGERVVRVPPHRMGATRQSRARPGQFG